MLDSLALVLDRVTARVMDVGDSVELEQPADTLRGSTDVELLHALSSAVIAIGSEHQRSVMTQQLQQVAAHSNRRIVGPGG